MCSGRFLGGEYGVERRDLIFEQAVEIIVKGLELPMLHRGRGHPDFDLTRHMKNRNGSERTGKSQEKLIRG